MKRFYACVSLAFLVLGFAAPALATTYYTKKTTQAPAASDANSCPTATNPTTPKLSINGGVSCLSAGDTLLVGDGVYTDVVLWYYWGHQRSGTAGNPITIKSENYRGAIVRPGAAGMGLGLGGGRNIFAFENQDYWTVDGFVTDGTGMSGVIHFNSVGTVGLTILNTEMKFGADNNSGSNTLGVSTSVGDDQLTIQHNDIHDIGTGAVNGQSFYSYCMYFTATNSLIEDNRMSFCSGHGMHMHNTAGSTNGNIMRNNLIHHNGIPSNGQSPGVLWAAGGQNDLMYNNVIYNNSGSGVRLGGAGAFGSDNTVTFNTIVDNGTECIIVGAGFGSNNNHIQNNICDRNAGGNASLNTVVLNNSSGNTIGNNLSTAAVPTTLFVNPAGGDFRLLPGAPAINAGATGTGIAVDYAGATRDASPDDGAFEFAGVVSPPNQVVIFIAPDGDDARTCYVATDLPTPKRTLLNALACPHAAGSTFYLKAGTYIEQFDTTVPGQTIVGGTSWATASKIAAYNNEAVILQHPVGGGEFIMAFHNATNDHFIVIDGITLDGNSQAAQTGLGVYGGAHHIRFQNGTIKNTGYANVAVNGNNVELLNSTFQNAIAAPILMVGGTDGVIIRNNRIFTGNQEAIGPNGVATNTSFEISRNIISDTGNSLARAAITLYVDTNANVFNNILYGNNAGINVQAGASGTKIYNNTITGNVNNGIQIDFGADLTAVTNNIVYNNGGAIVNSGSNTTLTTNLTTNPPFANPGAGDFTLTASATSAINKGTTLSPTLVDDQAGVARPIGVCYDLGALEFDPSAVVVPLPPNPTLSAPTWVTQGFFR